METSAGRVYIQGLYCVFPATANRAVGDPSLVMPEAMDGVPSLSWRALRGGVGGALGFLPTL